MIVAAGILFLTPARKVLFLKRGAGSDHPGEWCFPGGQAEDGETVIAAAEREAVEELGFLPEGTRSVWTRRVAADPFLTGAPDVDVPPPTVDFTTFLQNVDAEFDPEISGEHTGYAWATISRPPQPLHPGCAVALARFTMDELGIARAMAAGDLASPQRYRNVWLFDLRITGTGTSYRSALDEHVYRNPDNYLNDEFLARCNGLPVIWYHPEDRATLDSREFAKRIVGTFLLPYIRSDEVWGIAKIYDDAAAHDMLERQLSTSPAVIVRNADSTTLEHESGATLLIEGKPVLLDHLAICKLGVWDKGGEPRGVARGDQAMAETEDQRKAREEKERGDAARADAMKRRDDESEDDFKKRMEEHERDDRARADAENGKKLDMLLEGLGTMRADMNTMSARMDSYDKDRADAEKRRMDAEEEAEKKRAEEGDEKAKADRARKDAARKDAAEREAREKEEREREDAARKDAEEKERVAKRLDSVEEKVKERPDDEMSAMADAQARCDSVALAFGNRAPPSLRGEQLLDYRLRLIGPYQRYSQAWGKVSLRAIAADPTALAHAEETIYSDAMTAARGAADLGPGGLRAVRRTDDTGRQITEFFGSWKTAFAPFLAPSRAVTGINDGKGDRR